MARSPHNRSLSGDEYLRCVPTGPAPAPHPKSKRWLGRISLTASRQRGLL